MRRITGFACLLLIVGGVSGCKKDAPSSGDDSASPASPSAGTAPAKDASPPIIDASVPDAHIEPATMTGIRNHTACNVDADCIIGCVSAKECCRLGYCDLPYHRDDYPRAMKLHERSCKNRNCTGYSLKQRPYTLEGVCVKNECRAKRIPRPPEPPANEQAPAVDAGAQP